MSDTPKIERGIDRTEHHYETLLAPIYRWMLGDFASAIERSHAELRELGVGVARPCARALDLGAGLGLQSIPLAKLGYDVVAVDGSAALLSELSDACPNAQVLRADLTAADAFLAGEFEVVVCMGDTLTHLRSTEEVQTLLRAASVHLAPGGIFLLTFRDYASATRTSTDRFILVRGDSRRILTCCLEYGADRVSVTDIVHELSDGQWTLRASEYEKLRLAPSAVAASLRESGLRVERCESTWGRVTIVARRPAIET